MKKLLILSLFFVFQIFFSQIKMELKIISEKKASHRVIYVLQIDLINESKNNYIVPIDTTDYKIYMSGDKCDDIYRYTDLSDLGMIPMIKDGNDSFMEGLTGAPYFDTEGLDSLIINNKERAEQHREKIKIWKKNHNIKGEYKNADINWYLYNQLKTLESGKRISFVKEFSSFWRTSATAFYYYWLQENVDYPMFLKICVDKKIYKYLTQKQKEEFKGYKFFSGKIQSNQIMIRK